MITNKRMLADLLKSGLDVKDAERAQLHYLDADETSEIGGAAPVRSYEIPYFGVDGKLLDFSRWKYLDVVTRRDKRTGKTKIVKYHQLKGTAPELYIPPQQKIAQLLKDWRLPCGITEGEKKAMKATKEFELTFGLGGIYSFCSERLGIDLLDVLQDLAQDGREIFITYDGDGHTNRNVRRAESALAERLTAYGARVWIRMLPPGTALDEILVERGADYMHKVPVRAFDAKAHVSFIRTSKGSAHDKKERISNVVNRDLAGHGRYLRTPQDELLYFDDHKHRLIGLDDQKAGDLRYYVNESYGVNPAEPEYPYVYQDVATQAFEHGVRADTHLFSHFDRKKRRLYIAASETEMLRITAKGWERVPNGTNSVYLRVNDQMAPIPDVEPSEDRTAFDYVLNLANLKTDGAATPKQMRRLIEMFAWAVIFGNKALPTRPILCFHGEKGSAKTSEGHALLLTLFGPEAKVTELDANKSDGLDAVITSQHLAVLDNVDGKYPDIENRFAIAATGGVLTRRQLYTTNDEARFPVRAFLIATTRDPKSFTRDDVVDRLLYMPCERRTTFEKWAAIESRVNRQRKDCWAYFLHILPQLIASMGESHPEADDLRMQDFASFAIGIAEPLGYSHSSIIAALRAGEKEKVHFVAEQSALPEAMAALFESMKGKLESDAEYARKDAAAFFGTRLTVTALLGFLKELPGFARMSPQALGTQLSQEWSAVEQRVPIISRKQDTHSKSWSYVFSRKASKRKQ